MLTSKITTYSDFEQSWFRQWENELAGFGIKKPDFPQRKWWEHLVIAQALKERGALTPGNRGIVFGAGREPLTDLFCAKGCEILITDQAAEKAGEWASTGQFCGEKWHSYFGITPREDFEKRVKYLTVDMNNIPDDIREYDFTWSSCSLEHLGSRHLGRMFMWNSLKVLKPGGVAVHTTEYNISSKTSTYDAADFGIYLEDDLRHMEEVMHEYGCEIESLDFTVGNHPNDHRIAEPDDRQGAHLQVCSHGYVHTSAVLIFRKFRDRPVAERRIGYHRDDRNSNTPNCPVCGKVVGVVDGDLSCCESCDHWFQWPANIAVNYDREYIAARYDKYPTTESISYLRLGFLQALQSPPARLLDVGYGNADFLSKAKAAGYDVFGCEVHGINYGYPEINLGEGLKWDIITFFDSLEHFNDLTVVKQEAARANIIIVSLPQRPRSFPDREWRHYRPGEHLHYFSESSLSRLFAQHSLVKSSNLEDLIRIPQRQNEKNVLTVVFRSL